MVNQGQNHIDSPANMLQQQASYEVSFTIYYQIILIARKETSTKSSDGANKFVASNFSSTYIHNAPKKQFSLSRLK